MNNRPLISTHAFYWLLLSLALYALLPLQLAHAQSVEATVDRNSINLDETLVLRIRQSNTTNVKQPDLTNLEKNFEVLSQSQTNQFISTNGRTESSLEWTFIIAPIRTGTLLIPSFELDGQYTTPIEITVNKPESLNIEKGELKDVFLEMEVSSDKVYVQEQLLVTVRLNTNLPISSLDRGDIDLPNTKTVLVSEENRLRTINGNQYSVAEWVYAVYPQQSGTIEIPTLNWQVGIGSRSVFSRSFRNPNSVRRLTVEGKTIEVEAKPDSFTGTMWLPAKQIALTESWNGDLTSVKQGEPITRSIIVTADGLTASQLPEITIEYPDNLNHYPEPLKSEEQKTKQGVTTIMSQRQAVLATQPGIYTLPEVKVSWWNTIDDREESAIIPERLVKVLAAENSIDNTSITDTENNNPDETDNAEPKTPTTKSKSGLSIWLLASNLATALIALFFAYLWFKRQQQGTTPTDQASPKVENSVPLKTLVNDISFACDANNHLGVRKLLLQWAKNKWSTGPYTLERIKNNLISDEAKQSIDSLNALLFSDNKDQKITSYDALIKDLKILSSTQKTKEMPNKLAPLNPV
ncbi:BatD family protein [Sessilibacter sp. MAH4]